MILLLSARLHASLGFQEKTLSPQELGALGMQPKALLGSMRVI